MIDGFTLAMVGLGAIFVLILLHVPIGIAMAGVGFLGVLEFTNMRAALAVASTEVSSAIGNEGFAVIALFLLMGAFASVAGLSSDVFRLANAFVGHRRGGLAQATVAGCGGFGAVCGSSVATTATMARVALPEMTKRNYQPHFSAGAIASGGTLGILIPPSVLMVLYAVLTENSPLTLFAAGLLPGLIAIVFYFLAVEIYVRINPTAGPAGDRLTWRERGIIVLQSWRAITIITAVAVGIYSGVFTVTEAASVGASLTLIFAVFSGQMTWRIFIDNLLETAGNTCLIFVIIIGANIFRSFMAYTRAPEVLVDWIAVVGFEPFAIILLLMVMYIILGSIFDTVAAMVITLPFVYPLVVDTLGYNAIWWGIMMVMVMEVGMITPPIGINVFVLHGVAKSLSLTQIYRGIAPFLVADFARLLLIAAFPILALWLPELFGYPLESGVVD
jgi:tripartite ATP-independent transporter DctM subunit